MIVTLATNKPVSKNLISKNLCEHILGSPSGFSFNLKFKGSFRKGPFSPSCQLFLLFERFKKIDPIIVELGVD